MKALLALVLGVAFGSLLQLGGIGKYDVLLGQLLLLDWTVAIVMLTAILVGMVGLYALQGMGKLKVEPKETRLAANLMGGLIFGAGFAISGYCPGSAVAALGEGHWDALIAMGGMVAGSYLYAAVSGPLERHVKQIGDLGQVTVNELLKVPRMKFVPAFALALLILLAAFLLLPGGI